MTPQSSESKNSKVGSQTLRISQVVHVPQLSQRRFISNSARQQNNEKNSDQLSLHRASNSSIESFENVKVEISTPRRD